MTASVDAVVVGAGVVGLACARALARAGLEPLILERADAFGTETSARNSEVIHAGLHGAIGSWRARLCVQGNRALYAYCAERGVAHRRCGKLVVACSETERAALVDLQSQAQAHGVDDLQWLEADAVRDLEPALVCEAALWSPSTGILDSHGFMQALLGDAQCRGSQLVLRAPVTAGRVVDGGVELDVGGEHAMRLRAGWVINAAGLGAVDLATRIAGLPASAVPRLHLAQGAYFVLRGRSPFSHLVYPVPGPSSHLGVHLTLDLAGQARFGPSFRWIDTLDYRVDPAEGRAFEAAIRHYWPAMPDDALMPGYAGVRPKLSGPGEAAADFRIDGPSQHGVPGLVNLFGLESPGLTAALAIAEVVQAMVQGAEGCAVA